MDNKFFFLRLLFMILVFLELKHDKTRVNRHLNYLRREMPRIIPFYYEKFITARIENNPTKKIRSQ
jgi:hypothetical protein